MSSMEVFTRPKNKCKVYKKTENYILRVEEAKLNNESLYKMIVEETSSKKIYSFPYLFDDIHSHVFNPDIKDERLYGIIYQDDPSKKIPPEFLIGGGLIGVIFEKGSKTFDVMNVYGEKLYIQPE